MAQHFWQKLLKLESVIGMSPMDGVTDAPMRYMTARYGRKSEILNSKFQTNSKSKILNSKREHVGVQVIFTEFVSVDALKHAKNPEAVDKLMSAFVRAKDVDQRNSENSESQNTRIAGKPDKRMHMPEIWPYEVAQVFGNEPDLFYQAAVIVATLGYDGIDINMGCPAKNVSERGSGAGLIRTPEVAQEIVRAAQRGVQDFAEGRVRVNDLEVSEAVKKWVTAHAVLRDGYLLPVSVKTRIGVDHDVVEEWMRTLMEVEPAIITLHGRTLKQLYQGFADWDAIGRAAVVVHSLGGHILGNGDVQSVSDGMDKVARYGVDGFLIGRAAEGNPAIFAGNDNPSWDERKIWMMEHAALYEKVFGPGFFVPMRKHLAWYARGFEGAGELRGRLVRVNSPLELETLLVE